MRRSPAADLVAALPVRVDIKVLAVSVAVFSRAEEEFAGASDASDEDDVEELHSGSFGFETKNEMVVVTSIVR